MASPVKVISRSQFARRNQDVKRALSFLASLAFAATPCASTLSAADVTLASANNSGYSWGVANETLNVSLDASDKFAGALNITDGSLKLASNYAENTFGSGAQIILGTGTSFDFNGAYLQPATITTRGNATITSSRQNTQKGLGAINMGGDLTLNAANRYCIEVGVYGGGYDIFKTGSSEIVVKTNITNLNALHIQEGTWSVESSVTGLGDGYVYLEGGRLKIWGSGRNVAFGTLVYRNGTFDVYTDGYSGKIELTGNVVLEQDNAKFNISATTLFTGDLSGEGKTLVHAAFVTPGANGDKKEQTGVWTFAGASEEDKGTTTLKNFQLTTRDSEIILGDYAEWLISGAVEGKSTGHKFNVAPNASLTAAELKGMKTLTVNGTMNVKALTMNQEDGSFTLGSATNLDSLAFTQSTALITNANLTAGNVSISEGATVEKTGTGVFTVETALTGKGNLIVSEGTLTQSAANASPLDSFQGSITIGANGVLDLNGKRAQNGYPIKMLDGASVTNSRDDSTVYWAGLLLDVEENAEITLAGNKRYAVAFHNNTANDATVNVTNSNYLYASTPIGNVTLNVSGVLGLEGNNVLNASEGNDVFVALTNGGRLTSWTGTNVHNHSVTQMTIDNGTINGNGNLVFNGEILLTGPATFGAPAFTSNNLNYRATLRINGNVSGSSQTLNLNGPGEISFFGDVNVGTVNLQNGALMIGDGTFQADAFNVKSSYSQDTLSGGTWEKGLVVDGGTLLSPVSMNAEGQTILMRGSSSEMKLGGTVLDNAQTVYRIDGGTFTLDNNVVLNGQIQLKEDALLTLGFNDRLPAFVSLNSDLNLLDGEIIFDVFSTQSFDQLHVKSSDVFAGASITLDAHSDAPFTEMIPIILSDSIDALNLSITNAGWDLALGNGIIYAYETSSVPEPATWSLLVLGAIGLAWTRRKK